MIPFLFPEDAFPPLTQIRDDLGGLLAVGADLSPGRLLTAYRHGIFPWGTVDGQPVWYNPDPRMVMRPALFVPRRSLRQVLRRGHFEVRVNAAFSGVIHACAATPRPGQDGTWITEEMRAAYLHLHRLGWAHSIETWIDGTLAGGLYGLAIGRMFYGESMFSHRPDASKIAFAHLCWQLVELGIELIDCQMHTPHLASLGAREIPRAHFLEELDRLIGLATEKASLTAKQLRYDW